MVAGHEILVGQSVNKRWLLGGSLLHKFSNTGMTTAISAILPAVCCYEYAKILPLLAIFDKKLSGKAKLSMSSCATKSRLLISLFLKVPQYFQEKLKLS